ncbi:MAG: hypothetical protein P8X47_01275 [Ignavibacteriaceae bacterium]
MEPKTTDDKKQTILKFITPLVFPVILWIIHLLSLLLNLDLTRMGIHPRHIDGLLGIITGPLIHADFSHLISNLSGFLHDLTIILVQAESLMDL